MSRWAAVLVVALAGVALAGVRVRPESAYRNAWCLEHRGQPEVQVDTGRPGSGRWARCDCLTEAHAVEVDWASNWPAALGQALNYADLTGRAPGLALIVRPGSEADAHAVGRARAVVERFRLPATVWVVTE